MEKKQIRYDSMKRKQIEPIRHLLRSRSPTGGAAE
jgi:hypothetical protein